MDGNIWGRPNVRLVGACGVERQSLQNNHHISNDIHFSVKTKYNYESKLSSGEMRMLRWARGKTTLDHIIN